MRRSPWRTAGTLLLTSAIAASLVAPAIAHAVPSTPQIRAKQQEAATARAKLQDLNDELEMKLEDYNAVSEALDKTRGEIAVTEQTLADTEARLSASQEVLAMRAQAIYRGGTVDILEVLLGTTDFNDFLTRIDIMNRISGADADLVAQVSADRSRVLSAQTALENRESEQIALRAEASDKKAAVEDAVARQKAFSDSLDAQLRQLIKDEEARQARIAAELARQAAEAAARAAGRRGPARATDLTKLGAPHPAALDVARRYVGLPYVWGGTTPSGFDCSGLTQYAYAQIGISLPRTSREQFRVGVYIPADRMDLLQPGDLLFFGYGASADRIHHVAMYAGNGVFLHAPGTGDVVKFSSLAERIATRGDYVGAVRP